MIRALLLSLILAVSAPISSLADPLLWQIRLATDLHDNFLQSAQGSPKTAVVAGSLRAGLEARLGGIASRLAAFAFAEGIRYDVFDPSTEIGGGLRWAGDQQSFELALSHYRDRPRFDLGDHFDRVDGLQLDTRFTIRPWKDWQLSTAVTLLDETYAETRKLDNRAAAVDGAVRYRGLGYLLSPEIGVGWERRDVDDPGSEYDQTDLFLKLRSAPRSWLYLSARYRHRLRDYRIADPAASNFGRRDTRDQLTLSADVRTGHRLVWGVYYAFEDADSTRPSRTFHENQLTLSLTLLLGS